MIPVARTLVAALRFAGVTAVCVLAGLSGRAWTAGWQPEPAPPRQQPKLASGVIGRAGCSAVACHGGPAASLTDAPAPGCWQGSATHWQACDPHQRAYSLLTEKPDRPVRVTATAIIKGLGWERPATEEVRCLACHTTPALAEAGPVESRREGVSCEACHGNASSWQYTHTTRFGRPVGMTHLNDLGVRAKTCVGCHVGAAAEDGAPLRDVNHDMIAAGHPRLEFDFGEHHRRLPKHWLERDRAKPDAPPRTVSEAHLWQIGRVAHAEAACELLASRANRARRDPQDSRSPWPEFAESNCGSCHHKTPDRNRAVLAGGRPPWQSLWPLTRLDDGKVSGLKELADLMGAKRQARPEEVTSKATRAAEQLKGWREVLAKTPEPVERFFPALANPRGDRDDLTAVLFGLAARQREKRNGDPGGRFADAFRKFREWNPTAADPAKAERDARDALNALLASPR